MPIVVKGVSLNDYILWLKWMQIFEQK
jgi:hypothetical protein